MNMPVSPDDELRDVEKQILWVLDHPSMSAWLKTTLRTALECDPVQVLNDLEMLRVLLHSRTDAIVRKRFKISDESCRLNGLVHELPERSSR